MRKKGAHLSSDAAAADDDGFYIFLSKFKGDILKGKKGRGCGKKNQQENIEASIFFFFFFFIIWPLHVYVFIYANYKEYLLYTYTNISFYYYKSSDNGKNDIITDDIGGGGRG